MILDALLIFQKCVSFLETFLFRREFPFSCEDRVSFSLLVLYVRDFSRIFGNISNYLFNPAKGNEPELYKGSQYLLTGLNPIPALTPWLRKMNPESPMFLSSLVGGRPRLCRPFADPFSSPVPSSVDVP